MMAGAATSQQTAAVPDKAPGAARLSLSRLENAQSESSAETNEEEAGEVREALGQLGQDEPASG